jgi:hypothetical protein
VTSVTEVKEEVDKELFSRAKVITDGGTIIALDIYQ